MEWMIDYDYDCYCFDSTTPQYYLFSPCIHNNVREAKSMPVLLLYNTGTSPQLRYRRDMRLLRKRGTKFSSLIKVVKHNSNRTRWFGKPGTTLRSVRLTRTANTRQSSCLTGILCCRCLDGGLFFEGISVPYLSPSRSLR
jgi:hypothetical protein